MLPGCARATVPPDMLPASSETLPSPTRLGSRRPRDAAVSSAPCLVARCLQRRSSPASRHSQLSTRQCPLISPWGRGTQSSVSGCLQGRGWLCEGAGAAAALGWQVRAPWAQGLVSGAAPKSSSQGTYRVQQGPQHGLRCFVAQADLAASRPAGQVHMGPSSLPARLRVWEGPEVMGHHTDPPLLSTLLLWGGRGLESEEGWGLGRQLRWRAIPAVSARPPWCIPPGARTSKAEVAVGGVCPQRALAPLP